MAHVPVEITFTHAFSAAPLNQTLKTDKEGIIDLGKLKHITNVRKNVG